jgi:hypothetical protein
MSSSGPAFELARIVGERLALAKIARQVLATSAPAMEEVPRSVFADLITSMHASWRMTAGAAGLALWDCGELGYWQREPPAELVPDREAGTYVRSLNL